MARTSIQTWLPVDEFAQIIGLDPLGFNGLHSSTLQRNNVCGDVTFQFAWQHSDRMGREDIAMAIQQAETDISREAGFNLMPDWTVEERLSYPRPAAPELYGVGVNVRYAQKSVEALKGYLISGGVRSISLIEQNAPVTRTDDDGDGYDETVTITVATTITDLNEFHVFYPNKGGNQAWEIRPITVSVNGGFATIRFKSWQIALASKMDGFNPQPLDADSAASYESTVDVYRVYNDPATQAQFIWEGDFGGCGTCAACQLSTQSGCFHFRDARLGIVVPSPASWNQDNSQFDSSEWNACREPDQVRLWYLSGYVDHSLDRPYAEMSPYWKYAVAYFAASKLDHSVCGCSNVQQFIEKWRRDSAFSSMSEGGFTLTAEMAANRLGTSMGALYAYRAVHKPGVRISK